MAPTQDTIETLTIFFNWVDSDRDGFITITEIREACAVDVNGDGVISDAEKIACGQAWIDSYLPMQDLDGDKKISLVELIAFNS